MPTYGGIRLVPGHLVFCHPYRKHQYGQCLQTIRDDETAAKAMGNNVFRYKLLSFVMACSRRVGVYYWAVC
jgi:ABC-type branched-subunit amino acid transport system permease subunit